MTSVTEHISRCRRPGRKVGDVLSIRGEEYRLSG